jgi:uncharacterized OsmC-like protein
MRRHDEQIYACTFDLDAEASEEQLATLIRLTECYCVVFQTLRQPPEMNLSYGLTSQPKDQA